jgi:hypothetical protein
LSVFPDYRVRTATCLKNGTVTKVKGRYVELKTGGKGEILVWRLVG